VITDSSGNILTNGISNSLSISTTAADKTFTFGTPPSVTNGNTYWVGVVPDSNLKIYYYGSTGGTSKYDSSNSYSSPSSPTDASSGTYLWRNFYATVTTSNLYQLDLEVKWTAADYSQTTEYLCIYAGSVDAENLKVDVWSGSWTNVIAALQANQWNNVSVHSYLTGAAFEIRFVDSSQTTDPTQSSWQIDAVLLSTWTVPYSWHLTSTAILVFVTPLDMTAVNGLLLLGGIILIPVSTLVLVHGGRDEITSDKAFFSLVLFCVGAALILGQIMP
jgi:hypothetical protein